MSLQRPRTDGEKEKNDLDIFEETKSASLPAELKGEDTAALVVWDILRMGPITNASALSTDDEVGSLESGKEADPIAVLTNTPRVKPLIQSSDYFNLHHNLAPD